MQGNIRLTRETFPLSPRDRAGIAAEPWHQMRNALESGRISTDIQAQLLEKIPDVLVRAIPELRSVIAKTKQGQSIDTNQMLVIIAPLLEPILKSLGISPDAADMQAITQQMLRYGPDARADVAKLQEGDFSPPSLQVKAPPLPVRQVSWKDLMAAWRKSTGGVLEIDGIGVSRERELPYGVAIRRCPK